MKFSVPEILMIILTTAVVIIAFLALAKYLIPLAKYLIRYAVKFYIKIKGDDLK